MAPAERDLLLLYTVLARPTIPEMVHECFKLEHCDVVCVWRRYIEDSSGVSLLSEIKQLMPRVPIREFVTAEDFPLVYRVPAEKHPLNTKR